MKNQFLQAFTNLDNISIQHKVQFNANEATNIEEISDLIFRINEIIPKMQYPGDNPNNGRPHHTFDIGKEYSRVIYLNIVKSYMPKNFDYNKLSIVLGGLADRFLADEAGETDKHDDTFYQFRIWWD